jgi:hypothetical protein
MSNLLQKASIITTPTAYDSGKILSVKPVQYYGPELVTNGDFSNSFTNWISQGDSITIVDGAARINRITNTTFIQQNVLTSGKTYLVEFDVLNKPDNNGTFIVRLGSNNVYDVVTYEGTRFSKYITSNGVDFRIYSSSNSGVIYVDNVSVKEVLNADFDFTRGSSATRVGSNGLIQDVASNLPRIDYTGGVGSWKFEPQRTNLLSYSEDFSQWVSDTNASITSNSIISPDGTLNADKLIAGSSVARQAIKFNLTASGNISAYVFAKKGEYSVIQLTDAVLGQAFASFDLDNGLVGATNIYSANIENYGNGWFKCIITFNSGLSINSFRLSIALSATSATRLQTFSGNGSDGLYIYGAQLESGSYPTSYIVSNSGSATTRSADAANNSGSSDLISSTEGVLYAEISSLVNDSDTKRISLSDGTSSNRISLLLSDETIGGVVVSSGGVAVNVSVSGYDTTLNNKILFKYKENDYSIFVNGFEILTDTSGATPIDLNELRFDNGYSGNDFYGNTKSVAVFKEALTDLELECLSSWMSFSDLGINFGYTVE